MTPTASLEEPKDEKTASVKKLKSSGVTLSAAFRQILQASKKKPRAFVESVDMSLLLNVDPRKSNQAVRGMVALPAGTGKKIKLAVFCRGEDADKARDSGATVVGAEDLVKALLDGSQSIDFDRCIATPDMMPLVSRVAKLLGPRGLMPSPKLGTVTRDVVSAIMDARRGQIQFRAEKTGGVVHVPLGLVSFSPEDLMANARAFLVAVANAKPEGIKGKYFKGVSISATMGASVAVAVPNADPTSQTFCRV